MFAAFPIVKQLHEMIWYLREARLRTYDPDAASRVEELAGTIAALADGSPADLFSADVDALHREVRSVLMAVSAEVRGGYSTLDRADLHAGADLAGVDLRARRLCGADLRGACLIAADLRSGDLAGVDLLGADLRDARIDGADLLSALYLTQPQVNAARGSSTTRLPGALVVPAHWRTEQATE